MPGTRIFANGLRYPGGEAICAPIDEGDFGRRVLAGLGQQADIVVRDPRPALRSFRGELEAGAAIDLADPHAAGWTFLVNGNDPAHAEIVRILEPLARSRGMRDPKQPLVITNDDDPLTWMTERYLGSETRPRYVLFVGDPDQLTFSLQSLMDAVAYVGRVAFDSPDDLDTYVKKIVRLEAQPEPAALANALFFGTDGGPKDPTHFSRRFMVEPLADLVQADGRFGVVRRVGADATRTELETVVRSHRPGIVYTASHGVGAVGQPLDMQRRINGALCCQRPDPLRSLDDDVLFTAAHVPADDPFLEGSIWFQFACHGYGTPAESDFAGWGLDVPRRNAEKSFVAALPTKLLAHPRGPIAFIGHVDAAWLHGFDDPDAPDPAGTWHPRLAPFRSAMEVLLKLKPPGLAMDELNQRFNVMNKKLADVLAAVAQRKYQDSNRARRELANQFIIRNDAQNYFVLGDPAARLRVIEAD